MNKARDDGGKRGGGQKLRDDIYGRPPIGWKIHFCLCTYGGFKNLSNLCRDDLKLESSRIRIELRRDTHEDDGGVYFKRANSCGEKKNEDVHKKF